jgi:hypothetical protein
MQVEVESGRMVIDSFQDAPPSVLTHELDLHCLPPDSPGAASMIFKTTLFPTD